MDKATRLIRRRWEAWHSAPANPDPSQTLHFWRQLLHDRADDALKGLLAESPETIGPLYETVLKDARADGKFYTPQLLADYLADRTLGERLAEAKNRIDVALAEEDLAAARQAAQQVRALRIADPSCGCGIFLLAALRRLHAFFEALPQTLSDLRSNAADLLDQLHGVDIDETALMLARWSLGQTAARLDGRAALPEVPHLVCADALGFSWIREESGFDFMLGNPPYLTEARRQAGRFRRLREDSTYYRAKMDLCDAFIYLGWDLLNEGGTLAYVLPEYWLQRNSARPLREHLWQHADVLEIRTFGNRKLFRTAPGHHTSLLILSRHTRPQADSASRPCLLGNGNLEPATPGRIMLDAPTGRLLLGDEPVMTLLETLAQRPCLFTGKEIQQGIVFPQTRLRENDWKQLPEPLRGEIAPGAGIFVLTTDECAALGLTPEEARHLKPYYEPGPFRAFEGFSTGQSLWMIYADHQLKTAMAERPGDYPSLAAHLRRFEPVLTSAHKPYGLHRARQPQWFESTGKILGLRQTFQPAFAVVDTPAYVGEGFYSLLPRGGWPPDFIAGLLNSSLAGFWFYHQKRKGHRLQVDKDVLLAFPAPVHTDPKAIRTVATLSRSLAKAPSKSRRRELDDRVLALYGLDGEARRLVSDFKDKFTERIV